MSVGKNYLSVMQDIATNDAKRMSNALETALVNVMSSLNIGMISFAPSGNNSYFDVPRTYATMEDDVDTTGNEYCVREIIAVLVKNGHIYIVPDTPDITDELLNELECWTHFTCPDTLKLKDLEDVAIRATDNYYLINRHDMMVSIFKSCNEALKTINEPLKKTINISEPDIMFY